MTLVFCFAEPFPYNVFLAPLSFRENLSKDLYLMSQMDSDQFVPVWTIASMEGIKALTTDMDLILDVLRSETRDITYFWGGGSHVFGLAVACGC